MSAETSIPPPRTDDVVLTDAVRSLLDDSPIGFALVGSDGRIVAVNRLVAEMLGLAPELCPGHDPAELLSACGVPVGDAETVDHGGGRVVRGRHRTADGRLWDLTWFPVSDPATGDPHVALIAVRDGGEVHRDEQRLRALLQVGNQIVWTADAEGEVHEDSPPWRNVTGQSPQDYLGRGWFAALHPDDRSGVERAWDDAVLDRTPFDALFRVRTRSGGYAHYRARAKPVMEGGEVVEWVGSLVDVTTEREADELRQRLNQQLSEAAMRTARLQKATSDLAEALTADEVVAAMSEIGRSGVGADHTCVVLLDRNRLRLDTVVAYGDRPLPLASFPLEHPDIAARAIADRLPRMAADPTELGALLEDAPEVDELVRLTPERAWAALPMMVAGRPIGALRFAFSAPREIGDEERVFLEALAGQCALAIGRAALYEQEHNTAEELQRSLLPDELPEVRGVRLAAYYRSGSRHVQVGGDWYDAFPLPDGRVAGVLGDVMGKGIPAAAGMSRIRNALRALAFSMPEPADVLTGLDRMFSATEGMDQVTTLVYFVLDPVTGQLDLSNAGHLPPLVVAGGARPSLLDTDPDTPLGITSPRGHHKFFVQPGNTVALYSDGLVENRKRSVDSGLDELVDVASSAPPEVVGDPQQMLEYLVESMLEGYEQDDDVTLLAVQLPVIDSVPDLRSHTEEAHREKER
ncbi:SpoIIE family protein phosphatase [Nocardiopsis lambiniae]|uniref:SpoIIE family protein phosphatase n=1 Tax=Nocardiopsis lambiniae TaxID=3075539 RepID=A0ABU2MDS1_9ACTN|nr:SpoIIE family protein phosphatase [Nocardiopsis sp. DSM 44743]MDT0330828.1 SpoIIE family protein phosphatase [Nocardiopsis sp. DSM 44743]